MTMPSATTLDEPQSFEASIAENLEMLGFARLAAGDRAGAERMLRGAATMCLYEDEPTAKDNRLAELRTFARLVVEEVAGWEDNAPNLDKIVEGIVLDSKTETEAAQRIAAEYRKEIDRHDGLRKDLLKIVERYNIEDEL